MKIYNLEFGSLGTNCYVIIDEKSGETAVIDPGQCNSDLLSLLGSDEVSNIKYILLTHGHFDHILGVYDLKQLYPNAKIAIHPLDAVGLTNEEDSLALKICPNVQKFIEPDILINEGDSIYLGETEIKVIHTPGHSKGSVCFINENTIFSGDTLFCRTVGRTDFKGGSDEDMLNSVKRLADLEGDYRVLPGHNRETTLDVERQTNRYMRKM